MDEVRQAADAVVHLVASAGVGALTPADVDTVAGLPAGSCVRLFPDRTALLVTALDYMISQVDEALLSLAPTTGPDPVEWGVAVIRHLLGPARPQSRALLCLALDPETRRRAGLCGDALIIGWTRRLVTATGLSPHAGARWVRFVHGHVVLALILDQPAPSASALRRELAAVRGAGAEPTASLRAAADPAVLHAVTPARRPRRTA